MNRFLKVKFKHNNVLLNNLNNNKVKLAAVLGVTGGISSYCFYNNRKKQTNLVVNKEEVRYIQEKLEYKENIVIHIINNYIKEPVFIIIRFGFLCYNFLPVIISIPLCFLGSPQSDKDNERKGTLLWYKILRNRCQTGGPTFIKLAQWAASRSDIFPKYFCFTLSNLHSQNKPHAFRHTRRYIKNSLDCDIEDIFEEFDREPIGVGAIAQVYRAKLKPGVENLIKPTEENQKFINSLKNIFSEKEFKFEESVVAIKVLHPNVRKTIDRDLIIMKFFAHILNVIPYFHWLSLPGEVDTFGKMMKSQLDLREEAYNLLRLRKNFEYESRVEFPKPYVYLSTRNVLVEEYELALPINKILHCNKETVYDKKLAQIGLNSFLHMLIYDNFIHSDLHPGNIMVKFYYPSARKLGKQDAEDSIVKGLKEIKTEDLLITYLEELSSLGFKARLVFLDAGLVTTLDDINRRNLLDLFRAIAEFDGHKAGKLMIERSKSTVEVLEPEVFALKMQNLILEVKKFTFQLRNVQISKILGDVMDMVQRHHVKLESDFINVVLSILILEGVGRRLDPDLDLFGMALPILRNFGTYDAPRYAIENATTHDKEKNGIWWLKLWVQLETRQWLTKLISAYDDRDIRKLIDIYGFDFFDM